MNIHDAALIVCPGKDRDLDPPNCGWWSRADEARYQRMRERLVEDYIHLHAVEIDEWCRDRFIDEIESEGDAEYDRSKESFAP